MQLTLELTRHLCASAVIATADSTASADHPMINPIWRGRLKIGDVLIPLRPRDPVVSVIHAALTARAGWFVNSHGGMVHYWIREDQIITDAISATLIAAPYSAACAFTSADTWRMARASCSRAGCAPDTAYFPANT